MRRAILYIIVILFIPGALSAQTSLNFDDYFVDKTMRLDYFHIGDAKEEWITVDQVYEQGTWAGSQRNLIDNLDNGRYKHTLSEEAEIDGLFLAMKQILLLMEAH